MSAPKLFRVTGTWDRLVYAGSSLAAERVAREELDLSAPELILLQAEEITDVTRQIGGYELDTKPLVADDVRNGAPSVRQWMELQERGR